MIIKTYDDGRIAEIVINPAMKPVSAAELVRLLIANNVTCAEIIRTTQPAKENPCSADCDPNKSTGEVIQNIRI